MSTSQTRLTSRPYKLARRLALLICDVSTEHNLKETLILGLSEMAILADVRMPKIEPTKSLKATRKAYLDALRVLIGLNPASMDIDASSYCIIGAFCRAVEGLDGLLCNRWNLQTCRRLISTAQEIRLLIEEYGEQRVIEAGKEKREQVLSTWQEAANLYDRQPLRDFIEGARLRVVLTPVTNGRRK